MQKITVFVLILFLATFAFGQKSVLFLVGAGQEATGPEVSDDFVMDELEALGWTVEVIYLTSADEFPDSSDAVAVDLVVISSTVNSTHIGTFYYDKPVPVFTWETGMYGKLGIATGGGNITLFETNLLVTADGEGHPAMGELTGEVEVLAESPTEVSLVDTSQYSENLVSLAEMIQDDGTPRTCIFALEEGAMLLDSTAAPARRIGFFFRDKTAEVSTEAAFTILRACLTWTMGEDNTSVDELRTVISNYQLFENYPNPFNPSTTISFSLPTAQDVTLSVYNNLGQKVQTLLSGLQAEGQHAVQWNGRDEYGNVQPSGVYYYEISSDQGTIRNKMLLMK
jgi:hypothetical protein